MAAPNETMMISDIINGIRKISSSETKNIFLNKTDGGGYCLDSYRLHSNMGMASFRNRRSLEIMEISGRRAA